MQVVYTGEDLPEKINKSIFLAGNSLRPNQEGVSWRIEALKILENLGYDGVVFVPENRGFEFKDKNFNYDNQINWEETFLNLADCILFWVPRDLEKENFGLTTNCEWGTWCQSGKVVFGAPPEADKVSYLKFYAEKYNIPVAETLADTLQNAISFLGEGAVRQGGERYVPLFIWNTPSFQNWYMAQTKAGNKLEEAKLLYNFRPGYKKFVFLWVLHAKVFITTENRYKTNEFVLSRTDISSVCLYYDNPSAESNLDTEIVLVKEFRTPASTPDGFIYELPGGSAPTVENPEQIASEEVHEETGLLLSEERFKFHMARQLAGTFSAHKSHLFSVELTKEELDWFKAQKGIVHGNIEDSEMTYVEVHTLGEIIKQNLTDFSTIGMIAQVLLF